jgi:hypothetical protein
LFTTFQAACKLSPILLPFFVFFEQGSIDLSFLFIYLRADIKLIDALTAFDFFPQLSIKDENEGGA